MIRRLHIIIVSIILSATYSLAQGGLGNVKGYVKDADGKPADFATVMLKQGETTKASVYTDDNSMFEVRALEPGFYDIIVKYDLYPDYVLEKFYVRGDQTNAVSDIKLSSETLETVRIVAKKKLIDPYSTTTAIGREDFGNMAVRDAAEMVKTQAGVLENEGIGEISIRGSRPED